MSARSFLRLKYLAPFAISVVLYISAHPDILKIIRMHDVRQLFINVCKFEKYKENCM